MIFEILFISSFKSGRERGEEQQRLLSAFACSNLKKSVPTGVVILQVCVYSSPSSKTIVTTILEVIANTFIWVAP